MTAARSDFMIRTALYAVFAIAVPSVAAAHVSVTPRESTAGAEETYTVGVPTEGAVATTHLVLEIPQGVTVLEVPTADGVSVELTQEGDRTTSIIWRKEIPPKEAAEFVFRARNPSSARIIWRAHQHFADGTRAEWIGESGDRRPAAVTTLTGC